MQKKSRDVPQALKCPMCNNKLKVETVRAREINVEAQNLFPSQEAMLLPCCKKSACRSCAERGLMRSRKNGKFTCSQCGSDRYAIKDLEPNYTLRAVIDELSRTQHKPLAQVRMYFLANGLFAYPSCCVEWLLKQKQRSSVSMTTSFRPCCIQETGAPAVPQPLSPPNSPPNSPPAVEAAEIPSPPSSPPSDDAGRGTDAPAQNKSVTCLNCGHRVQQ